MKWYFAHPETDKVYARAIASSIRLSTHIETFNPFYDGKIRNPYKNDEPKDKEFCEGIMEQDLLEMSKCDGLFAILNEPSSGVAIEIYFASKILHIPVILCSENPKILNHVWLSALATSVVSSFDQLLEKLKEYQSRCQ